MENVGQLLKKIDKRDKHKIRNLKRRDRRAGIRDTKY